MAAADPRLYLIAPAEQQAAWLRALGRDLSGERIACVLLPFDPGLDEAAAAALVEEVQAKGVALLIADDPARAMRLKADGTHITGDRKALGAALAALKPSYIVGAGGLATRDDAMHAGEAGVDYVMFGEAGPDPLKRTRHRVLEQIEWWAEIFTLPCVGYAETLSDLADLASAGADFLALGPALWGDTRGPAAALAAACQLVEQHSRSK
jgi:thiamine-phosphate pyrophosphorylase